MVDCVPKSASGWAWMNGTCKPTLNEGHGGEYEVEVRGKVASACTRPSKKTYISRVFHDL